MSKTLSLALYNLALPFALLAMAPAALVKMRRRGGRWRDFNERLGFLPAAKLAAIAALPQGGRRFWVHAVSVGEVNVARKIIAHLITADESCGVVLTTTTPTGHQIAQELAQRHPGRVVAAYSPLDVPFVARRIFRAIRPTQLVLVEAEVWPNIVHTAAKLGVPVSLINARLSHRSESRFRVLGGIVRPVFALLDQVLVQEPEDIPRWVGLGVPLDRVFLTGSVKFDPEGAVVADKRLEQFRSILRNAGWTDRTPTVVAASTHPGEELRIAEVCERLRTILPDLMLLIVPRHVERTPQIVQELRSIGVSPALRTELEVSPAPTNTVIVNTTGELRAWQCLASVVIIGKSFLATGGQNPAEALMARKPVIFGPHMENFAALTALLLREKGALSVSDFAELQAVVSDLLKDSTRAERIAESGYQALTKHKGATARTITKLLALD